MSTPETPPIVDAPAPQGNSAGRFFGWMMIGCGGLIAVLCGACTLFFGGLWFGDWNRDGGLTALALFIGGAPTLVGVALVVLGVMLARASRKPPPPPPPL